MTSSPLVDRITERLEGVGYRQISTPFSVASITFEFEAALIGKEGRSADLVLVVDTSIAENAELFSNRLRQKLEALSRALDLAESSLVLTLVLAGVALTPRAVESFSKSCRVLVVSEDPEFVPNNERDKAFSDFEDRIRILLPLRVGEDYNEIVDPLAELNKRLEAAKLIGSARRFVDVSTKGDAAVARLLKEELETRLKAGLGQ